MSRNRRLERTRHPGIYKVMVDERVRGYLVSYRIRGLGQRTKTLRTLREATEFQASVRDPAKAHQMRQLANGRVTLAEYFPAALGRKRTLAPSTRQRYEEVGRKYIIPSRLGRIHVASVTRDDVEFWVSDLVAEDVPPPSIDKAYRTLRVVLEMAQREGKAISNPARKVEVPKSSEREPFFLTADQVDLIANEVPARHRALVYLLAYTGLRIGEASALRLRNLDLVRQRIAVSENSPEVGGRKMLGETKTRRKRSVEVSDELCNELADHLDAHGLRSPDGNLDQDAWVFTHGLGGQIRQNNWRSRVFQPACRRAGVVRKEKDGRLMPPRVHDLRHTAASLAAAAGYSLHEVKELLGHTTIKTTSDQYLHLFPDDKREKAKALGRVLAEAQVTRGNVIPLDSTATKMA